MNASNVSKAVVLAQLKQGRLLGARQGLRLAQHHQIAPEIAAVVDVDE